MVIRPAKLSGVFLVELELKSDIRGFFARTYCEREFAAAGLNTRWPQANLTRSDRRGTIRGLHWQADPRPEIKLVRCAAGAIWDVVVDVRPSSPTFGRWESFELSADNRLQVYIPEGFAHGFQSLTDGAEVSYMMGETYFDELARGIRWDDAWVGVTWPLAPTVISERDSRLSGLAQVVVAPGNG
jgi:dTDP-4-dehydrorhamnose 3,5-epimerase